MLIVSPQFMRAEGLEFHNGNNSIYFAGTFDRETKQFLREEAGSIDYGLDFYALTIREHLDYKFIMALEGNDVASNLKWVMSSNSIAVMTRPTLSLIHI